MSERGIGAEELLAALARGQDLAERTQALEGVGRADLANALVISDRLTSLQHRHRVVEALYHTAVDLTSLKDVGAVLQAIVRRAREVIMTDVSYITLLDPEIGGTRVRASVGTTSPAFDTLTLESGVGLGGLVVQTGAPVVTHDYFNDERLTHAPDNDASVVAERLRTMLGVPLRVGDRNLGVLFVANRGQQVFGETDIDLLSSLAAHAAMAVANAQLYEEMRSTAEQLEGARQTISQHARALEVDLADHIGLSRAVLRPEPLTTVVRMAADALDGDLAIVAPNGTELARHISTGNEDGLARLMECVPLSAMEGIEVAVHEVAELGLGEVHDGGRGFTVPLSARGEVLAYAYAWLPRGELDVQDRAIRRTFLVLSFAVMGERFERQHQERSLAQFFDYLTALERFHTSDVSVVARSYGVPMEHYDHICVWTGPGLHGPVLARVASALTNEGVRAAPHDSGVTGLVPHGRDPKSVSGVVASLDLDPRPTCGIASLTGRDWDDALREAKACAQALLALGRDGMAANRTELGVFGVLAGDLGRQSVEALLGRELSVLQDHDANHGTSLVDTVDQWFANNFNHSRTADKLHVHVNTLYRRMSKIKELLGPGWDRGDRSLELRVALRLSRLR